MLSAYNTPKRNDIAVCMCYFSAVGYKRPRDNFMKVKSMLDQAKIPLFTAECVIGNTPRLIPNPTVLVRSNSALFYKERLYNLLEPKIPHQYKKLICMDADIIFDKPNWVDEISKQLETYTVVQPFSKIVIMDPDFKEIYSSVSAVKLFKETGRIDGHPGSCWAVVRQYFKMIGGFYDKGIIGSGDTLFACCVFKVNSKITYDFIHADYRQWVFKSMSIPTSHNYLGMTIYHLYHGDTTKRKYNDRHKIPELLAIKTWDEAVCMNKYGMYELKSQIVNNIFKEYFLSRKEDD